MSSVLIQLGEVKKTHKEGRVFGRNLINKAATYLVWEKAKELDDKHKLSDKEKVVTNKVGEKQVI